MNNSSAFRQRAFDALRPAARPVDRALQRAQEAVRHEVRACPQRSIWTPQQRAANTGSARWGYATNFLKEELEPLGRRARFFSTPSQESQGLFLWLLDNVCLRVKREPQDLDQQALLNLLDEAPDQADLTACLTWRTSPSAEIDRVGFVAGHGSPWVIPLSELLAAETPNIVVTMPRRTPVVASRLSPEQATDVEGAASATNDN